LIRREDGTGTIYKRNDKIVMRKRYGTKPDGSPLYKYFTGDTEAEVKKQARQYELKREVVTDDAIAKMPFGEYFKMWMSKYKKRQVKDSTYEAIDYCYSCRIQPYDICMTQMKNLNTDTLQDYFNELVDNNQYARATVKKTYDTINNCLKKGRVIGHLIKNPMDGVSIPTEEHFEKKTKNIEFFEENDFNKIIKEAKRKYFNGTRVYQYGDDVLLLLYTGIRIGEGLALKWENVDIENKKMHIKTTISRIKSEDGSRFNKETSTKTKKSNRCVYLTSQAIECLNNLKKRNSPLINSSDYLFLSEKGKLTCGKNVRRCLNAIQRNAHTAVQNSGLHTLRHTFATTLIRKGVDIKIISELLGHTKVSTTYDCYIHVIEEQKHQAFNTIENAFSS